MVCTHPDSSGRACSGAGVCGGTPRLGRHQRHSRHDHLDRQRVSQHQARPLRVPWQLGRSARLRHRANHPRRTRRSAAVRHVCADGAGYRFYLLASCSRGQSSRFIARPHKALTTSGSQGDRHRRQPCRSPTRGLLPTERNGRSRAAGTVQRDRRTLPLPCDRTPDRSRDHWCRA